MTSAIPALLARPDALRNQGQSLPNGEFLDGMKIATFTINNVNRRLPNLLAWLAAAKPVVVCLQELKSTDRAFPAAAIEEAGNGAVWLGEWTWKGVAILARKAVPVLTRRQLPGDPSDRQSRYIEAAVGGILVASIYLPNGNPQPGQKFEYKLAWFERLISHADTLMAAGVPVVLAGAYNVAPTELDIYPTTSWSKDALVQPRSRAAFRRLLDQGWTDAIRARHPEQRIYTFWRYLRDRWASNAGLGQATARSSPPGMTAGSTASAQSGGDTAVPLLGHKFL